MSDVLIQAEGLGKKYVIGHQAQRERYIALRDVIARSAKTFFRKASDLAHGRAVIEGDDLEEVWALKDVSFEVKRGEVLGIIGRNGAGKSTLLKILSRITEPSAGRVTLRGRVASLLEVGTGFHPELSGRENIFLNGAILGMTRAEIRKRFDEIVAFAEVEKFLDTPVKRYSSGMYVRLAFAVAAHLEPEILVVDEVLAVGDAEFQKRCLGKLHDVSATGRTVLFVSHNMSAVKTLTSRGLVLDLGRVVYEGSAADSVQAYRRLAMPAEAKESVARRWGAGVHTTIRDVRLVDTAGSSAHQHIAGDPLRVEIEFFTDGSRALSLEVFVLDAMGARIALASTAQFHGVTVPPVRGVFRCLIRTEPLWLASGPYLLDVTSSLVNTGWDHYVANAVSFEVPSCNPLGGSWDFKQADGFGFLPLLASRPPEFVTVETDNTRGTTSVP